MIAVAQDKRAFGILRRAGYNTYLLLVLMVILIFNKVDRVALGLLMQDIKVDLALSDTQLGFLTGIAFALFYAVMGIPIARWADRGNRVTIITATTFLWSVAVALCGAATSFLQLLLIRIGVAIGEAGCIPPAHSLIADYFSRAERPRAVAIYMLGIPLSMVCGYFAAGWLNDLYGWRTTFVILGVPGLVLALIAGLTLREPRKLGVLKRREEHVADEAIVKTDAAPPLGEVCVTLWNNVTFRHLLLSYSVVSFFGYGITQWKPAFFIRTYELETLQVGMLFGAVYAVSGLIGMPLGGWLAARRAANNEPLQLKAMAIGNCAFGVLSAGIYVSPNATAAFVLLGLSTLGYYMTYGPLFATLQSLVPARMRAMALATIYLFANLVGMGLGPLAAGALSDGLRALIGEESLRWALLILCPGYLWAGWHLWRASLTVARDLEAVA